MATVLELVERACYEGNIAAPSTLVGVTDPSTLQLLHLFYATGRELRSARVWPQLKRQHLFELIPGKSQYPLPADFYQMIPDTECSGSYRDTISPPLTDAEFVAWSYPDGYATTILAYRIFGPDITTPTAGGQFEITPTPTDDDAGTLVSFEYISSSWLQPKRPAVGDALTTTGVYFANGNLYTVSANGTLGAYLPTVNGAGAGDDSGVRFLLRPSPDHAVDTFYAAGQVVHVAPSSYYIAVHSGRSGPSSPPSGTGTYIEDGGVRWAYLAVTPWSPGQDFEGGEHVLSSAHVYRVITPGRSGNKNPAWTAPTGNVPTAFRDQDVSATFEWIYRAAPYETVLSNEDTCLFDEELLVAGLKWRFLRARGLEYRDLKEEYESHKDAAAHRFMPLEKLSLSL